MAIQYSNFLICLLVSFPNFLGQFVHHQSVAVLGPLQYLLVGNAMVHLYSVPVLFVHMVAGLYGRVAFPKLNGNFGVAFYVDAGKTVDVGKGKHFTFHLVHQSGIAKRHFLGYPFKAKAIAAECF